MRKKQRQSKFVGKFDEGRRQSDRAGHFRSRQVPHREVRAMATSAGIFLTLRVVVR